MVDVHDTVTRSYNMSRIRSKDTKPEMLVRKALFANGFRFRVHDKKLPGKPDIVMRRYSTVIFIHGCFWHGHSNCKYFKMPQTRSEWWLKKINTNRSNDNKAIKALKREGWRVVIIWGCQLKPPRLEKTLSSLLERLL